MNQAQQTTVDVIRLLVQVDDNAAELHSLNMQLIKLRKLVTGLDAGPDGLDSIIGGQSALEKGTEYHERFLEEDSE